MSFLTDFPDAKLYYAMVKDHVEDRTIWDDCVQEAIIAVWQAREKFPGRDRTYYAAVARKRIKRVSSSQLFLDAPPETCGKWMERKQVPCGRRVNHPGRCVSKDALNKSSDTCRRTNASHDILRRSPDSLDQMNGWCRDDR